MAGRIPPQFIDELLSRVDIVDVVDSRVALKKAGREYTACCPFHHEKTPSFTVSPGKQFYHCFGCGAHGTAITFLMEYERLEFVDAIEELASMAGLEVPREASLPRHKESRNQFDLMTQAAKFYRDQLRQHEQAEKAVAYLKKRGVSGEIAVEFGIGYAPPGWDNLLKHFTSRQIDQKQLQDSGMLIAKPKGGFYDRFRDRVMFPIHDRRGRVIGFGGRALGDETPKYLNSPETELFHKGRELYGLYEARKHSPSLDRMIVVEGYMDVVSLSQFGIKNVVATLGTATTADHLDKLFRIVPEVIFCFDGDRAGRQAAWRAVEVAIPHMREGRQIKFVFLPEGEDPDTIVRHEGEAGFVQRLKNAEAFSNFFYQTLSNNIELNTLDGRSSLVEKARPYLTRLPEGVFQHMMVNKLAEISHVDSNKLSTLIYSASKPNPTNRRESVKPAGGPSPVRQLIRLLLEMPVLAEQVEVGEFKALDLPGVPLFIELIETIRLNPHINYAGLLERWRDTENGKHLTKLAQQSINLDEAGIQAEFSDALQWLTKQQRSQRAKELLAKSHLGTISDEEKRELKDVLATKL